MTKHCPKCSRELPLSEFGAHRGRLDGRQPYCRDCRKPPAPTPAATATASSAIPLRGARWLSVRVHGEAQRLLLRVEPDGQGLLLPLAAVEPLVRVLSRVEFHGCSMPDST